MISGALHVLSLSDLRGLAGGSLALTIRTWALISLDALIILRLRRPGGKDNKLSP